MVQSQVILYTEVVKSVLLYGSKSWVVTEVTLKLIQGLHHKAEISVTGMMARRTTSGEWEWPLMAEVLDTDGILKIKEYIQRRRVTIAAQVACRPIYELCTWGRKDSSN